VQGLLPWQQARRAAPPAPARAPPPQQRAAATADVPQVPVRLLVQAQAQVPVRAPPPARAQALVRAPPLAQAQALVRAPPPAQARAQVQVRAPPLAQAQAQALVLRAVHAPPQPPPPVPHWLQQALHPHRWQAQTPAPSRLRQAQLALGPPLRAVQPPQARQRAQPLVQVQGQPGQAPGARGLPPQPLRAAPPRLAAQALRAQVLRAQVLPPPQ